jgi:hypothetical protein
MITDVFNWYNVYNFYIFLNINQVFMKVIALLTV